METLAKPGAPKAQESPETNCGVARASSPGRARRSHTRSQEEPGRRSVEDPNKNPGGAQEEPGDLWAQGLRNLRSP